MRYLLTIILLLFPIVNSIANTDSAMKYFNNGMLDSAQSQFLKIISTETNKDTLAKCYHYLANINYQKNDFVKSLNYFKRAQEIYSELGNTKKVSNELNNIGLIYLEIGELDKAKSYILKSFDIDIKGGQTDDINSSYTNLHVIENSRGNYADSEKYVRESIKWPISNGDTVELAKGYSNLGAVLINLERYENIILYLNKKILFLSIIVTITSVSIILITFGLYKYWRNYKQKKKLSDELELSNKKLSDRNKDITDSIQYAKRLQDGILGGSDSFESDINNGRDARKVKSKLLFLPKDIVSGDFYWTYYAKNGSRYIAIGDCTGHGVPGSMITIVGHTSLTKIVDGGIYNPGDILTNLDKIVKSSFSGGCDIRDGMDITLIQIDEFGRISFAGANNFIYLRKGNDFEVVKGDKCYVGAGDSTFTTRDIDVNDVSHIYMFTDGVIDQFGGPNGKKFKQSGLKSILLSSNDFNDIVKSVNDWKNGYEQTDDITLLEIKL